MLSEPEAVAVEGHGEVVHGDAVRVDDHGAEGGIHGAVAQQPVDFLFGRLARFPAPPESVGDLTPQVDA